MKSLFLLFRHRARPSQEPACLAQLCPLPCVTGSNQKQAQPWPFCSAFDADCSSVTLSPLPSCMDKWDVFVPCFIAVRI